MTRPSFKRASIVGIFIAVLSAAGLGLAVTEWKSGKIWPEPQVVDSELPAVRIGEERGHARFERGGEPLRLLLDGIPQRGYPLLCFCLLRGRQFAGGFDNLAREIIRNV